MKLSKRIYAIADQIRGESAADIGTDHGYVPLLLMMSGKCSRVIMSDISEGSLAKAKETFRLCGLEDRVPASDFRVGDGLDTIDFAETNELIIAGLGGHTIAGILGADIQKSVSFERLVLQPRKHSGSLRYFLYTHGWDIECEQLAEEGKFACEIICAAKAPGCKTGQYREPPYPEDDIRWKYPEYLIEADPLLASKRIEWKLGSINEQLANLLRSSGNEELAARLRIDRSYLLRLLQSIA